MRNRVNAEAPRKRPKNYEPDAEYDQQNDYISNSSSNHVVVYFTIEIEKRVFGNLEIELYDDVPLAAENFRSLATGGREGTRGQILHYKHSVIYANKGPYLEGGDIISNTGRSGESIYGPTFSDQEGLRRKHSEKGLVSLKNTGFNTFDSRFMITLTGCPNLDFNNIVVGRVIKGLEILDRVANVKTLHDGTLTQQAVITDSGQISGPRTISALSQFTGASSARVEADKRLPVTSFCEYCREFGRTSVSRNLSYINYIFGGVSCLFASSISDHAGTIALLSVLGIQDLWQVEHNCSTCGRSLFVYKPCLC